MTFDEITKLERAVAVMRDEVSEFAKEFATATDADLHTLIEAQGQIRDDAEWKLAAAQTELRLRRIAKLAAHPAD